MTKYIIGTISSVDTPLTPKAKGSRSMAAYLTDVTEEDVQRERDEILHATAEEIRGAAAMAEAVLSGGAICVLGNEGKVAENESMFRSVSTLA